MSRFWWTEERVARLRDRLAAGVPARDVAVELGCSRNAVIGAARRLLGSTVKVVRDARVRPGASSTGVAARVDVQLLCEIDALPVPTGVALRDLRARHCRWVAAEGAPWVFCGETVACGSYCAAHAGLVYVKYRKGMFDE